VGPARSAQSNWLSPSQLSWSRTLFGWAGYQSQPKDPPSPSYEHSLALCEPEQVHSEIGHVERHLNRMYSQFTETGCGAKGEGGMTACFPNMHTRLRMQQHATSLKGIVIGCAFRKFYGP